LKHEELEARQYRTIEELREHVTDFIERIYNVRRLHSALAYRSPAEFEKHRQSQQAWMPATLSFLRHEEIYSDGEFH
jgi:putative transposase